MHKSCSGLARSLINSTVEPRGWLPVEQVDEHLRAVCARACALEVHGDPLAESDEPPNVASLVVESLAEPLAGVMSIELPLQSPAAASLMSPTAVASARSSALDDAGCALFLSR